MLKFREWLAKKDKGLAEDGTSTGGGGGTGTGDVARFVMPIGARTEDEETPKKKKNKKH